MEMPDELLHRQAALQSEANAVCGDLGLDQLLSFVGDPVRVGSSALGLMIRRDVDITVICLKLDRVTMEAVAGIGARLATHQRVWQVRFRDDTGRWNTDPDHYPDGLYLGVDYRSPEEYDWNLDIWFVDEPDRQPDLAHLTTILPRLTSEARMAILRIKHAWVDRAEGGPRVRGFDVYRSVLDDQVRTPEQFDQWRIRQTKT
ncbi:MAG: hypothetical protein M3Z66_01870 [Chloroflexota bacterium]|nr:hypothetical protein [Chloroflexota bacterium]